LALSRGLGYMTWAQAVHQRMGRFTLERWVSALALAVGVFWLVERVLE